MKDLQHIVRMAAVFIVSILLFLFVRSHLVPPSYGKLGRYRAASVEEIKNQPIAFAGRAGEKQCAKCHREQVHAKSSAQHKTLGCETCHGPLAEHVNRPKEVKPMKPKESEIVAFCVRCHGPSLSKPSWFKTVDPAKHNPENPCIMCHQPHAPGL